MIETKHMSLTYRANASMIRTRSTSKMFRIIFYFLPFPSRTLLQFVASRLWHYWALSLLSSLSPSRVAFSTRLSAQITASHSKPAAPNKFLRRVVR